MKPRKIRRTYSFRRRSSFRRRRAFPWKSLLTVAACAALMVGGFFTLKLLVENPVSTQQPSQSDTGTTAATPTTGTTVPTQPPKPTMPSVQNARGYYVPTAALTDTEALAQQMDAALEAGFNALVFDLKDIDGYVLYQTEVPAAQKAQSVKETALTVQQLQEVLALCEQKGVLPLPRIYAFHDHVASNPYSGGYISGSYVMWSGDRMSAWHDWYADQGGQTWLNPAAEPAQKYILDLLVELKQMGFTSLMVDGVQFPDKRFEAFYGNGIEDRVTPSVLSAFVQRIRDTLTDSTVIVCAPGTAAIGSATAAFGDNPLMFGASVFSPSILPSTIGGQLTVGSQVIANPSAEPVKTMQAMYEQVKARVGLMETGAPQVLPFVEAGNAAQTKEMLQILASDGCTACILYRADGVYDFAAY